MRFLIPLLPLLVLLTAPAHAAPGDETVTHARGQVARIAALNPRLNAVITVAPDAAGEARRCAAAAMVERRITTLGCATLIIKDNIDVAGLPTTAGSLALIDNVAAHDSAVAAAIRAQRGIILGKANLSEWANIRSTASISGWSAVGGQARNPYALDRNPCGSSSGTAVAVATGLADMGLGTETDGSITCPAAMNGLVGLKPTVGLVSQAGIVPISASQDSAGPITRTVEDAWRLMRVIAGPEHLPANLDPHALAGKRIGVLRFATGYSAPTDAVFERALALLRAQGATLVDIAAFPGREEIGAAELTVLLTEFRVGLNAYLAGAPATVRTRTLADLIAFNRAHADTELALFGQDLLERAEATRGLNDPAYVAARSLARRRAGAEGIDRLLREHDLVALVAPTIGPAFPIDAVNGDQLASGGAGSLAAVAGYPHLTVPMGAVRGLPVGLSFIGPAGSDGLLLDLGFAYEQASHARIEPRMLPSIESSAEVAPLLAPHRPPPRRR